LTITEREVIKIASVSKEKPTSQTQIPAFHRYHVDI